MTALVSSWVCSSWHLIELVLSQGTLWSQIVFNMAHTECADLFCTAQGYQASSTKFERRYNSAMINIWSTSNNA